LVDDGSPTPVEEIADALGAVADGVRWLRYPRNRGIAYALNWGIAAARGRFIARLDSDDVWRPTKIANQFPLFAADADPTITATGMDLVTPQGNTLSEHIRPGDWSGVLRFLVDVGCPFPHGSVLALRETYRVLGGYPLDAAQHHCEDFALWCQ